MKGDPTIPNAVTMDDPSKKSISDAWITASGSLGISKRVPTCNDLAHGWHGLRVLTRNIPKLAKPFVQLLSRT